MNKLPGIMWFVTLAALLSLVQAQDSETRWLTHYTAESGGFATVIETIQADFELDATVKLEPFGADGTLLSDSIREVTIQAGHRMSLTREDLQWQSIPVSHVRLSAPESVRVTSAYRRQANDAMTAHVRSQQLARNQVRFFPEPVQIWFDGLVAVNPNEQSASLTITLHDFSGNSLRVRTIELPSQAKWLDLLTSLFSGESLTDRYVSMVSDQPLFFLGLRGSLPGNPAGVLTELTLDAYTASIPKVTYANQVSRLMQRACTSCHHDGGIGPFPLTTFDEVYPLRSLIAEEITSGSMPPWKASERCEEVVGSTALDPAEKQLVMDWLNDGALQGQLEREPEAQDFPPVEWQLGIPDQEVVYSEPYTFDAGPDQYVCFPVALNNAAGSQLSAIEVLPGNASIVHHVLVFVEDNSLPFDLDQDDQGPGYTCFGGPGTGGFRLIAGWAPGMTPTIFPENVGMTLPANSTAVIQVHYNFSTEAGEDRTRVGLHFSEERREEELLLIPMVEQNFLIPAGAKNHVVNQRIDLPFFVEADLYLVAPHMHLLGQSISLEASFPDGTSKCLVDIPKWDFDWQRFYHYPEPIPIPGGTTLSMNAVYDNSTDNPFNPNSPPKDVGWGEATTDEMALVFLGVVSPLLSLKEGDAGSWQWPTPIVGSVTQPKAIAASIDRKRAVKSCCSQVAAAKAGMTCPNQVVASAKQPEQPEHSSPSPKP